MPGAPDPLYVRARKTLLDAADALAAHLDAVVLVGAQAIYVHAGDADLVDSTLGSVPEYTTDADFSLDPAALGDSPLVAELMAVCGFSAGEHPGEWHSADGVRVDLMVPEALAGAGSRGARLGPHGKRVARRAKGLEGALVDRNRQALVSLDPADNRSVVMNVAGPGALLVAKIHKIADRAETRRRGVSRTRTRWMFSGSCRRPKPRISQDASCCWQDPNPVRRSPPRRSIICLVCLAARTVPEPRWLSAQPVSTPMRR